MRACITKHPTPHTGATLVMEVHARAQVCIVTTTPLTNVAPNCFRFLRPEAVSAAKVLLLGSGTLGCNIGRSNSNFET